MLWSTTLSAIIACQTVSNFGLIVLTVRLTAVFKEAAHPANE